MSLSINIDRVKSVLIGGQWYHVANDSFLLDAYEYTDNHGMDYLRGGQEGMVPATGFSFDLPDGRGRMSGPLTAIQAVIEA